MVIRNYNSVIDTATTYERSNIVWQLGIGLALSSCAATKRAGLLLLRDEDAILFGAWCNLPILLLSKVDRPGLVSVVVDIFKKKSYKENEKKQILSPIYGF